MTVRPSFHVISRAGRWVLTKPKNEVTSRSFSLTVPLSNATLRRSLLFDAEKKKQRQAVGRIEKIEVDVVSDFGNELLIMNKDLSTPHDCAKHISKFVVQTAVVALINSNQPWDMHRPLTEACRLQFLKTTDKNPWVANNVFWRSCSFMLGAVVSKAFRDDISVVLHSFPSPNIQSGSFVLDAYIGLESWNPSPEEMRQLSKEMVKLSEKELIFERLSVTKEVAEDMFSDNPYKLGHISKIYGNHNEVVIYRLGDHVDISRGPMMSHTGLIGRCTIASVHYLKEDQLYRFQGVALPKGHKLNHYAYGILEKRAMLLNSHMIPSEASLSYEPTPEYATEAKEVSN
ncbi:39S ribosomal protein L39, mitochondrial [Frankliniella fusca]|uniref:39S ribosomal protein L39, mitochondrial n=1 Tax=Frankliniella fusca TaxID=407009 RepID=A0AAE1HZC1_9NEOP|nr:39S ribosomal protein L39, mitochondrial [Frankliniella fusca]